MDAIERDVIFVILDISGYTKFIFPNQKEISHSQTIKSTARRPWAGRPKTYNTWFYEPLVAQDAIDKAVHWVLGDPNVFLITAGDMQMLPKVLDAAERFDRQPADVEMAAVTEAYGVEAIFR